MKLIGIGGLPRSGKDTLADLFIASGYYGFSFGDFTRKHSRLRHKDKSDPISIKNMTETSNWLRDKYGPDVILKEALKEYEEAKKKTGTDYKGLVLYSVRAPVEVNWLLDQGGELVWVESGDEVRYRRAMRHLREGEAPVTLEEFQRQEALQWQPQPGIPEEVQMNTSYVRSKATRTLINNYEDMKKFLDQSHQLIQDLI